MCRPHWYALPRIMREAISDAWRERRLRDWSANCLTARTFLRDLARDQQLARAEGRNPVTPERAAQLRDRILGERSDA